MKNKVLVFTIATGGYDHLFESCIKTQIDYCRLHDYKYVVVNESPRKLFASEAAWLKVPLSKAALKQGYDWVFFIDADCEIRPNMPPFVEALDSVSSSEKTIFMATGTSGRINSGVILIKQSDASIDFLDQVISHSDEPVPVEDATAYENGHIIHFGKNSPSVYILEHEIWNNNSKLDDNSFIQHYSGGALRKWYMGNRAPKERQKTVFEKLMAKIKSKPKTSKISDKPVSESFAELLPFYLEKYSDPFSSQNPITSL